MISTTPAALASSISGEEIVFYGADIFDTRTRRGTS